MNFDIIKSTLMRNELVYFIRNSKSILGKPFFTRRFARIQEYASRNPAGVTILSMAPVTLYTSHVHFGKIENSTAMIPVEGMVKYTAILHNVRVIGGSGIIILDKRFVLYDAAVLKENKNVRLIETGSLYSSKNICLIQKNPGDFHVKEAIFLIGHSSFNYYHFLYEIVARLAIVKELNIDPAVPLIADRSCAETPQFMELLALYNSDNRPIIFLDLRKIYHAEKIWYVSLPSFIIPGLKDLKKIRSEDVLFDVMTLDFLRRKGLENKAPVSGPRRVYLSRKNASSRRRFNEAELFEVLKPLDFQEFFPEDHSLAEQIAVFNNADFIIGGCGAAFTNILFCKPECKIICFINYRIELPTFSALAAFVGVEMIFLKDDTKHMHAATNVHDSYVIDKSLLQSTVSDLLHSKASG